MFVSAITHRPIDAMSPTHGGMDEVIGKLPDAGPSTPAEDSHLTFTLAPIPSTPTFPGRPAMTFRIPREYVWLDHAYDEHGRLCRVPLRIQLPGPKPWRDEPPEEDNQDEQDLSAPYTGRYVVHLGAISGHVARERFLHAIDPANPERRNDRVADGRRDGLIRYSLRGGSGHVVPSSAAPKHSNSRWPDIQPQTGNLENDRSVGECFSPLRGVHEDAVVHVSYGAKGCLVHFGFDGRGASLRFTLESLPHWEGIVNPIRALIRSFVVQKI